MTFPYTPAIPIMGVDPGGTGPPKTKTKNNWSGDDNIDVSPEVSACYVHLYI